MYSLQAHLLLLLRTLDLACLKHLHLINVWHYDSIPPPNQPYWQLPLLPCRSPIRRPLFTRCKPPLFLWHPLLISLYHRHRVIRLHEVDHRRSSNELPTSKPPLWQNDLVRTRMHGMHTSESKKLEELYTKVPTPRSRSDLLLHSLASCLD
jgi:hypothetical protein